MRIYAKKAFLFTNPDKGLKNEDPRRFVRVPMKEFSDVPDWVKNTRIFRMGTNEGSIEVVAGDVAPVPALVDEDPPVPGKVDKRLKKDKD